MSAFITPSMRKLDSSQVRDLQLRKLDSSQSGINHSKELYLTKPEQFTRTQSREVRKRRILVKHKKKTI